jgi:hypothetical protein
VIEDSTWGRRVQFTFDSTVTGTTHAYERPDDLVDEIVDARVHGGMHFRNSVRHGAALGRAIAKWQGDNALRPLRGPRH